LRFVLAFRIQADGGGKRAEMIRSSRLINAVKIIVTGQKERSDHGKILYPRSMVVFGASVTKMKSGTNCFT